MLEDIKKDIKYDIEHALDGVEVNHITCYNIRHQIRVKTVYFTYNDKMSFVELNKQQETNLPCIIACIKDKINGRKEVNQIS